MLKFRLTVGVLWAVLCDLWNVDMSLEFVAELMGNPKFATAVAVCAAIASAYGVCVARKSVGISQDVLGETRDNNLRNTELDLAVKRLDLLREIRSEQSIVDDLLLRIGRLETTFEACSENVKRRMGKRARLFIFEMPELEEVKETLIERHRDATEKDVLNDIDQVMQLLAKQDVSTKNTQFAVDLINLNIDEFEQKMALAKRGL